MSSVNEFEIEEVIFRNSGFRGRVIKLMLWTDTEPVTGLPVKETIEIIFPTTMSLQLIANIVIGIDKNVPVLAIIDGCQVYKMQKLLEFANKSCEGCGK